MLFLKPYHTGRACFHAFAAECACIRKKFRLTAKSHRRNIRLFGIFCGYSPGFEGFYQDIEHYFTYMSFPEYDKLRLLLMMGKSGTMLSRTAYSIASQLQNDGSRTLPRSTLPVEL